MALSVVNENQSIRSLAQTYENMETDYWNNSCRVALQYSANPIYWS